MPVGEPQRVDQVLFVRVAVDAEQADRGGNCRLDLTRRRPLEPGQRLERTLISYPAKRQRRIVLKRTVEFGDGRQSVERVLRFVIAEGLDDGAPEEILATADLTLERLADTRIVALGGERADERRPHKLALLLVERSQEVRNHRTIRMVFEKPVRDRAETIVGALERFAHEILRPRIVEPGQERERAIPHVAVSMFGHRLNERGNSLSRRRAPN